MTTLAWDGTTFAADRQLTLSYMRHGGTKLFTVDGGIAAISGRYEVGLKIIAWLQSERDPDKYPKMNTDRDDESAAVYWVMNTGRAFRFFDYPLPMPLAESFFAAGSGRDYALGALAHGADAIEAVQIACRFDTLSGVGVDAWTLSGKYSYEFVPPSTIGSAVRA